MRSQLGSQNSEKLLEVFESLTTKTDTESDCSSQRCPVLPDDLMARTSASAAATKYLHLVGTPILLPLPRAESCSGGKPSGAVLIGLISSIKLEHQGRFIPVPPRLSA